jgi:DNA-binding beta-propeller fold protein YncE
MSPDGATIFYTARGSDADAGTHSLWSVPAAGGAATELETGFVAPLNLAVSSDGGSVFVADTGFDTGSGDEAEDDVGALFSVPAAGGAKTEVEGTYGFAIRGLDVRGDAVVFSGKDPADGVAGVFSLEGGVITPILKGAPLTDPSGIALEAADDGNVYVVDTSGGERGALVRINGQGDAQTLVDNLDVGYPAGAALTFDEATLLVSGLQDGADAREAVVFAVDLATNAVTSSPVAGNDEAGGLHRAKDVNEYAWAGSTNVYRITFE